MFPGEASHSSSLPPRLLLQRRYCRQTHFNAICMLRGYQQYHCSEGSLGEEDEGGPCPVTSLMLPKVSIKQKPVMGGIRWHLSPIGYYGIRLMDIFFFKGS